MDYAMEELKLGRVGFCVGLGVGHSCCGQSSEAGPSNPRVNSM